MSKEFDIDCLLKSIDYNLTDIARAEFHKWLRAKDKTIADLEAKLAEQQECNLKASAKHSLEMQNTQICVKELEAKLAESEKKYSYMKDLYCEEREKADNFCTLLNKKIAMFLDVKQQLAESEEAVKYLKGIKRYDIGEMLTENTKLKQQLAEKEDRISRLQFEVQQALSNSLGKTIKELIEFDNQGKISFAVEQLEKVKEFYTTPIYDIQKPHTDVRVLLQRIDNQIKQLKEMR